MKELSIEEKAKAYDEALRVLHKYDGVNILFSQSLKEEMFPELAESEDERIRKSLIDMLKNDEKCYLKEIAWLEKQGEHAKFRDSIQVGDKVTRNQDGVLVNLSQLNRVAKKDEKQCDDKVEQKPWGEEDEWCLEQINFLIRNSYSADDKVERLSNWVKSLRDRCTWKPSDAQMIVLNDIIINGHLSNANERILKGLQEQLKRIKD